MASFFSVMYLSSSWNKCLRLCFSYPFLCSFLPTNTSVNYYLLDEPLQLLWSTFLWWKVVRSPQHTSCRDAKVMMDINTVIYCAQLWTESKQMSLVACCQEGFGKSLRHFCSTAHERAEGKGFLCTRVFQHRAALSHILDEHQTMSDKWWLLKFNLIC